MSAAVHLVRTEEPAITDITTTCAYVQAALQEGIVRQVKSSVIQPSYDDFYLSIGCAKQKYGKNNDTVEPTKRLPR